jgi:hypothetical protein
MTASSFPTQVIEERDRGDNARPFKYRGEVGREEFSPAQPATVATRKSSTFFAGSTCRNNTVFVRLLTRLSLFLCFLFC